MRSNRVQDAILWLCIFLVGSTFAVSLMATRVYAKWKPQYAEASQEIQNWYKSRKLTEAARKRFAFGSCCDGSDKVETQFKVDKATGDDEWFYLQGNQWLKVPEDVIWWDEHSPTGEAVLFAIDGKPTCFFPPRGGL